MPDTAVAATILGLTYLAIASERVNRPAAALAGAVATIAVKPDGFDDDGAKQSRLALEIQVDGSLPTGRCQGIWPGSSDGAVSFSAGPRPPNQGGSSFA